MVRIVTAMLLAMLSPAYAETQLTQDELATWIYEHSNWEVDVRMELDLQFAAVIPETASFMRVEECDVTIEDFRVLEDGRRLLDSSVTFDLTHAALSPGMGAVFPPPKGESPQFYSYFWKDDGTAAGRFISVLTFFKLGGEEFTLLRRDYIPIIKEPNIVPESLSMREAQIAFVSFSYNFPIDEAQIEDLSNAIIEYQQRFCTLVG